MFIYKVNVTLSVVAYLLLLPVIFFPMYPGTSLSTLLQIQWNIAYHQLCYKEQKYFPVFFHDPTAPHKGRRFGFHIIHDLWLSSLGCDDWGQITHRAHSEVPEVTGAEWGSRHCSCVFSLFTFRQAMLEWQEMWWKVHVSNLFHKCIYLVLV